MNSSIYAYHCHLPLSAYEVFSLSSSIPFKHLFNSGSFSLPTLPFFWSIVLQSYLSCPSQDLPCIAVCRKHICGGVHAIGSVVNLEAYMVEEVSRQTSRFLPNSKMKINNDFSLLWLNKLYSSHAEYQYLMMDLSSEASQHEMTDNYQIICINCLLTW